jgi:hypothetical protein
VKVTVNRAPVLTLWGTVVAQRLGFSRSEALTLGRALAGLTAQSKGQWLGIYEKRGRTESGTATAPDDLVFVNLMGRSIPAVRTPDGVRAADKGKPADPESVKRYLGSKFGSELEAVEVAMQALADSLPPDRLEVEAYSLYEAFRPKVEKGKRGWGARGELDLDQLARLRRGRA